MAGVTVVFGTHELAELGRAIRAASKAPLGELMQDIAARGESATRKRIEDGGPAPDGTDWPDRHPANKNPNPLLNLGGHLGQSIQTDASADAAVWGSSLVYARIHQLGGTIVPRNASALFSIWMVRRSSPARSPSRRGRTSGTESLSARGWRTSSSCGSRSYSGAVEPRLRDDDAGTGNGWAAHHAPHPGHRHGFAARHRRGGSPGGAIRDPLPPRPG